MVVVEKNGAWNIDGRPIERDALLNRMRTERSLAFPAIHGTFGEDGELGLLLETSGIPFVGSGSRTSRLAIDKQETGDFLSGKGIRVPESFVVTSVSELEGLPIEFPCIVKPKDE
jgi:D-alanine-D-alanine ligase